VGLVIVPTPLGNLRDITLRALDVLRACDLIVAEDTRVARRLLAALDLPSKPLWSYREQNAAAVTAGILERARDGTVALVSDAGMPSISDPGRDLVRAARDEGIAIEALPGPTAFVCAAVLSGFDLRGFSFQGFVPRAKGERERAFAAALVQRAATVWYETPARVVATLETLVTIAPEGRIFVARELTKRYEQQLLGTPRDVLAQLEQPPRGEFVLVLEGRPQTSAVTRAPDFDPEMDAAIESALWLGMSIPEIAREFSRRGLGVRDEIYRRASALRRKARREEAAACAEPPGEPRP